MVSIAHIHARNGPRRMNPLRDWGGVAQLMRITFQSDVTVANLPLFPDWPGLRWLNGLINLCDALGMETPEQMFGYVWEESGRIVGNATIGLSSAALGIWLLSNVAVHPDYRRRGIARALVEMAIKEARHHGGQWMALQVQSDNSGAKQLYERLGFRSLEQTSEFVGANVPDFKLSRSDVTLAAPTREQWTAVQSLVNAHLPPRLKNYRHSLAGLFQMAHQRSLLAQVGELLRGIQQANWCLLRDSQVVGGLMVQAQLSWGAHRVGVVVAPGAQGQVEELLITQVGKYIQRYASRRVTFVFPASYTALTESLKRQGLREARTLDLMALAL